jgi:hypothetical protein
LLKVPETGEPKSRAIDGTATLNEDPLVLEKVAELRNTEEPASWTYPLKPTEEGPFEVVRSV